MLPTTLQFLIVMIATAINDRLQRKPDYTREEVGVLEEQLASLTGGKKICFTARQRRRLAEAGKLRCEGIHGPLPSRVVRSGDRWAVDREAGQLGDRQTDEWQGGVPVSPRWNSQFLLSRGCMTSGDEFPDTTCWPRRPGADNRTYVATSTYTSELSLYPGLAPCPCARRRR